MNAEIRRFEVSIRKFIEETENVPLEVKYIVLRAITGEVKEKADAAVIAEYNEMEKKKEAEGKDAESVQQN